MEILSPNKLGERRRGFATGLNRMAIFRPLYRYSLEMR